MCATRLRPLGQTGIVEGEGWLDVSKTPDAETALARVQLLGQEFGAEVETWPLERIRDVLKTNHYFHAIHFPRAFHVNPLAYTLRLADAAERDGVHIFEHTPAITIDPAGVRKRVATPQGRVRAGRIVLAGNVIPGGVAQRLSDTLLPVTAYTGVTKPLGRRPRRGDYVFAGAVSDPHDGSHHYRIVGGDRLLWTGGATVKPRRAAWMKWKFERAIRSIYPQLGPVEFESFWSGDMGFAIHGMPQIGEVQPGVWLASGFGGQGINTSAFAGDLIARAMVEGDDTWRLFLPYELVWAGGRAGRAIFAAATLWSWRRETALARRARHREERAERRRRAKAGLPEEPPRPAYQVVDATAMTEPPQREPARDAAPRRAAGGIARLAANGRRGASKPSRRPQCRRRWGWENRRRHPGSRMTGRGARPPWRGSRTRQGSRVDRPPRKHRTCLPRRIMRRRCRKRRPPTRRQ